MASVSAWAGIYSGWLSRLPTCCSFGISFAGEFTVTLLYCFARVVVLLQSACSVSFAVEWLMKAWFVYRSSRCVFSGSFFVAFVVVLLYSAWA